jgi:2-methylcitrate dehydratase PrpD
MDGYLIALCASRALSEVFTMTVFRAGYQNTCLIGTLAATIAVSHALRLDADRMLNAIALAAPHMIGLRIHTGTDFKAGQTGMASATAVRCSLLAEQGFGANPAAVDEVARLVGADPDLIRDNDPQPLPLATKVYPCVGSVHTAVEAAAILSERSNERRLRELIVHADRKAFAGSSFDRPRDGNQARFSMTYTVATSWLEHGVTLADFSDQEVICSQRQEMIERVKLVPDDDYLQVPGQAISPAKVIAVYEDGSSDEQAISEALGFPGRRLDSDGYRRKFMDCTATALTPDTASDIFDAIGEYGLFAVLARPSLTTH